MITLLILGVVALVALSIVLFTIIAYLWICHEQVKERQRL